MCKGKQELHAAIKQSGMEWTFIAAGYIAEALLSWPLMGTDLTTRTVTAPGSFGVQVTVTAVRDLGLLTAAAIVDPQAHNKPLYIGQHQSYEQVAAALEKATGDKFTRKTVSKEELEADLKKNPMDFQARFSLAVLAQKGAIWPEAETYKYDQFSYTPCGGTASGGQKHKAMSWQWTSCTGSVMCMVWLVLVKLLPLHCLWLNIGQCAQQHGAR